MKKILRVLVFLLAIAIVFSGTASAYETASTTVNFSINGGPAVSTKTYASTVEEFFKEQKIELNPADKITPDMSSTIFENLMINYKEYIEITLVIDGIDKTIPVQKGTVGKIVSDYSKATGIEYVFDNSIADLNVGEGVILEISSKTTKTIEEITEIPFETETVSNPNLNEGVEKVKTEGVNGKRKVVTNINYIAGKEVSRETISDDIIAQPIKKVIEKGTAKTVKGIDGVYQFEKELKMTATAYTSNYQSTGKNPGDRGFGITASGMKAKVGVVAVDPKIIPLGTKLYIEGYGYAVAGDTGGAIKGNKIDLYFNSHSECIQFGRKSIKVYVLK